MFDEHMTRLLLPDETGGRETVGESCGCEAEVEEAIEVLVEEELGMNPAYGEGQAKLHVPQSWPRKCLTACNFAAARQVGHPLPATDGKRGGGGS